MQSYVGHISVSSGHFWTIIAMNPDLLFINVLILVLAVSVNPFSWHNRALASAFPQTQSSSVLNAQAKPPKKYNGKSSVNKKGVGQRYVSNWRDKSNPRSPRKPGQTDLGVFDIRRLTPGVIVEYTNAKGSRRIALIKKRLGTYLEVTNDVMKVFTIPINRVNYLLEGNYAFQDLVVVSNMVQSLKPIHIERVYDKLTHEVLYCSETESKGVAYTLEYISDILHPPQDTNSQEVSLPSAMDAGSYGDEYGKRSSNPYFFSGHDGLPEPMKIYVAYRLMGLYGNVFFRTKDTDTLEDGYLVRGLGLGSIAAAAANHNIINVYIPLGSAQVNSNMKERAALREFKVRYKKLTEISVANTNDHDRDWRGGGEGCRDDERSKYPIDKARFGGAPISLTAAGIIIPDMPDRVSRVVNTYAEGLKQIVIQRHPWVLQGWARHSLNEEEAAKGRNLLEFLDLAPSAKNAKKVLEVTGMWKQHMNVEKYIMGIRDDFPPSVLAEARYLVDNYEQVSDTDERIRRDMRHLGAYAIDREGAAEVDDAVSIEYLDNGKEKLWIHIADVSRWVRPGSLLSLEAERRMTSLYMPDERISMFPEILTTELLSLGAMKDSYALSCGVTLNEEGEVENYEVCPSRVRVTRRLSYQQLDEILAEQNITVNSTLPLVETRPESSSSIRAKMALDLRRLHHWALLRNRRRIEKDGALDDMLRHKTELTLVVRERDVATGGKVRGSANSLLRGGNPSTGAGAGTSSTPSSTAAFSTTMSSSSSSLQSNGSQILTSLGAESTGKQKVFSSGVLVPRTKVVVNGYTSWSNASSVSLVSEYMVLMCQVMGKMCSMNDIPVWFKTQKPYPPLTKTDLELQEGENLFLRSARIIAHLRSANDSKVPGLHATTGSSEYVQCTSPIRRYHDLYNHYRLKAAMHAASLGPDYEDRAQEEAGITKLDQMATAEERLQTLIACRRVTRHRETYWMRLYIEKLCNVANPRYEFDCMVSNGKGPYTEDLWERSCFPSYRSDSSTNNNNNEAVRGRGGEARGSKSDTPSTSSSDGGGYVSEALIMQLGTFKPYLLYHRHPLQKGASLKCHLYKQHTNPTSYVLVPMEESITGLPSLIKNRLLNGGKGKATFTSAFTGAFENKKI